MVQPITYNLSRGFPTKLGVGLGVFGFVVLAGVTLIQVCVSGYETVSSPRADMAWHDAMWFDPLIPSWAGKHTTCDPAILQGGTSITTNQHIYDWRITYAQFNETNHLGAKRSDGSPLIDGSIIYAGQVLNCTINDISAVLSLAMYDVELQATVLCMDTGANIPIVWYMTTSTSVSAISVKNTTGFAGDPNLAFGPFVSGLASNVKQAVANLTLDWLYLAKEKAVLMSNWTLPASSQAIVRTPPCAQSCQVSLAPRQPSSQSGESQIGLWYQLTSYSTLNNSETLFLTSTAEVEAGPFWNLMSGFVSSVNLDIGTYSNDNIFLSADGMREGLVTWVQGTEIESPVGNWTLGGATFLLAGGYPGLPLNTPTPFQKVTLETLYNCKSPNRKGIGALLFSVFAATAATWISAWKAAVILSSFILTQRRPSSNYCDGHLAMVEAGLIPKALGDRRRSAGAGGGEAYSLPIRTKTGSWPAYEPLESPSSTHPPRTPAPRYSGGGWPLTPPANEEPAEAGPARRARTVSNASSTA